MGSATTAARRRWRWAGLFAAAGALGLGTELYLLREVLVALGGDETAVGLGLGAWLLGIALGAGAARALRWLRAGTLAAAGLGLLALAGWPAIVAARLGRGWLGVPAGELPSLGAALLLALGTFVLPGALVGGTFVALAAASTAAGDRDGQRAIGALYVAESLGSLAAGLLVSLVLVPLRPPLAGMALLAALALALALPAARGGLIAGRWALPLLVLGALGAAVAPPTARLEEWLQRARFGVLVRELPLLEWADTPYQSLAVGGGFVARRNRPSCARESRPRGWSETGCGIVRGGGVRYRAGEERTRERPGRQRVGRGGWKAELVRRGGRRATVAGTRPASRRRPRTSREGGRARRDDRGGGWR